MISDQMIGAAPNSPMTTVAGVTNAHPVSDSARRNRRDPGRSPSLRRLSAREADKLIQTRRPGSG